VNSTEKGYVSSKSFTPFFLFLFLFLLLVLVLVLVLVLRWETLPSSKEYEDRRIACAQAP
jgi:hypothetical protein